MSSQLSYRPHGREQRPKTLRKHYRDELDTRQVKASAKEPRACSARRLVSFLRAPLRPVQGHYAGGRSQVATTISDQTFLPFDACWYTCRCQLLAQGGRVGRRDRSSPIWGTPAALPT